MVPPTLGASEIRVKQRAIGGDAHKQLVGDRLRYGQQDLLAASARGDEGATLAEIRQDLMGKAHVARAEMPRDERGVAIDLDVQKARLDHLGNLWLWRVLGHHGRLGSLDREGHSDTCRAMVAELSGMCSGSRHCLHSQPCGVSVPQPPQQGFSGTSTTGSMMGSDGDVP